MAVRINSAMDLFELKPLLGWPIGKSAISITVVGLASRGAA
jgi:hypothetical protein